MELRAISHHCSCDCAFNRADSQAPGSDESMVAVVERAFKLGQKFNALEEQKTRLGVKNRILKLEIEELEVAYQEKRIYAQETAKEYAHRVAEKVKLLIGSLEQAKELIKASNSQTIVLNNQYVEHIKGDLGNIIAIQRNISHLKDLLEKIENPSNYPLPEFLNEEIKIHQVPAVDPFLNEIVRNATMNPIEMRLQKLCEATYHLEEKVKRKEQNRTILEDKKERISQFDDRWIDKYNLNVFKFINESMHSLMEILNKDIKGSEERVRLYINSSRQNIDKDPDYYKLYFSNKTVQRFVERSSDTYVKVVRIKILLESLKK